MSLSVQLSFALVLLACSLWAQDRSHARSMVVTPYGIVATSHVQASQAGAEILAQGGSAADAAIAANAVLGVTEPMMNGIGGDLFALYWVGAATSDHRASEGQGCNLDARRRY
jgi:gamma-glutamyltranspeptidase/glutathione hydrolase